MSFSHHGGTGMDFRRDSQHKCLNFSFILLSDCDDSGFNSDMEGFFNGGEDSR